MRTTIDKAGRLVIPKQLREALGIVPGPVELIRDGAGLRVEPVTGRGAVERGGRLVISDPVELDDAAVRAMRLDEQRWACERARRHQRRRSPGARRA